MIQRGAVQFLRQLNLGQPSAVARRSVRSQQRRDIGPWEHVGERAVVLRTIIEEFGGEVTSSALQQRLVQLDRWKEAKSDLWMRGILRELELCGALTLEEVNWTDMIVRLEPAGISLADDLSTTDRPRRRATS
jgi:hypothetical protein